MTNPSGPSGASGPSGSSGASGASGSSGASEPTDPGYVYVPMPTQVNFDSTVFKRDASGTRVLTDHADPTAGDVYDGMPASAADVNAPRLDADGHPITGSGDTGALDDPGSMSQFHTKQRFPVGTRTVHHTTYTTHTVGWPTRTWQRYDLWEYDAQTMITSVFPPRSQKGFRFFLVKSYTTDPLGGYPPTDYVKDLANKGGYWFNGKKYP